MARRQTLTPAPFLLLGTLAAFALPAASAKAAAFYLQEQSVRGAGRAFSGETSDKGPESLWWNPASVVGTPGEVYSGIHGIFPHTSVTDTGSIITRPIPPAGLTTPVGGDPHQDDPLLTGYPPNLAASMPIGDKFAVGLSVTSPFSFVTKYDADSAFRYEARKSRLTTINTQGVVAWRALSWLDVGAGFDASWSSATLTNASPNLSPLLPDGLSSLTGSGWNWGWNVGAQAHPIPGLTIGFGYHSKVDKELKGTVELSGLLGPLAGQNFTVDGSATFTTPWLLFAGLRWQAEPNIALNVQLQRAGWAEFDAIRVNFAGRQAIQPQNYQSTTTIAFGVDYAVDKVWTVRGGLAYDPTPTPDFGRTARVPDADRVLASVGASADGLVKNFTFDVAYQYVDFLGSRINSDALFYEGTPAQTLVQQKGTVKGHASVVSLGTRWRF